MNGYVFLQIFLLGVILAYVFNRTKSLVPSIVIHSLHNSMTFALILCLKKLF